MFEDELILAKCEYIYRCEDGHKRNKHTHTNSKRTKNQKDEKGEQKTQKNAKKKIVVFLCSITTATATVTTAAVAVNERACPREKKKYQIRKIIGLALFVFFFVISNDDAGLGLGVSYDVFMQFFPSDKKILT